MLVYWFWGLAVCWDLIMAVLYHTTLKGGFKWNNLTYI